MRRISFILALIALIVLCLCSCEDNDPLASNSVDGSKDSSTITENGESDTVDPNETEYMWTERF